MKRLILMMGVAAALSGCVSASKYKDLLAKYDAENKKAMELKDQLGSASSHVEDLSKSKTELEKEKEGLISAKATLEKQTADLAGQKAKLEGDMSLLRGEKETLEAEKRALLIASLEKEKQ